MTEPRPKCPHCKGPLEPDSHEQAVALIEDALYDYCDQNMTAFESALGEALLRHGQRLDQAAIDGEHAEDDE